MRAPSPSGRPGTFQALRAFPTQSGQPPVEVRDRSESAVLLEAETMQQEDVNQDGESTAMTVREAGKKGGDAVRKKYGPSFYEEIGRKGGERTKERHGAGFYGTIGQKGGNAVKDKYGTGFYETIGHKGGQKVKRLIEEAKKAAS